jgi:hypothetical protein
MLKASDKKWTQPYGYDMKEKANYKNLGVDGIIIKSKFRGQGVDCFQLV